ncbi:restriction endonuclease subunit S [Actinobacillus suis]|uniref:restriction endonuclease subunit S n=1 Tax=Actinobacillus suis TaxID=716 RepID=UPI0004E7E684|nr:restriction endonuclease subunit S [Actinobacillus suis]AIJ32435.1 restriction modification system DNA specificity subunit [Actinobacillus suis ATCC 33415]MCO4169656.1 restriction endonuclease subunit S [Actinobacillus suis]OQS60114.1 restriction endonuclease [Actinobacillus suis]SNV40609.1 restriction modification system DNA specificity subunit [Actinobacillus suis]
MDKLVSCQLGDLIEFQRGYDLPRSEFVEGEYPVQSSNGILGYHNEYKVEAPGITIGRSGTVGIPHLLRKNFFPHNTALFVKDFKGNDVEYIYYLLHYLDLGNQKSGSGVPTMNRNHLHPLKIKAYTDLETQQKISQVLTTLDRKIALNQQINAELEKMAKTLYDYWFVQFDFPDENGNPYKSSGGEMVYHPELKREVPKGWGRKTIGDYCKSTGGYAFKSSEWVESGNPVIKIKNIQEDGSLNISDIDFVDLSNKTIDEKFKVNVGDIVIAMTGATIGKFALIPKTDSDLYVNQRVGVFKLSAVEKLPFLINTLSQDYFRKSIIELSGGAAQPNISNEQINNIELIYPVENIIANFNEKLTASYKQIIQKRYETQKLTQLRDFLLPMLMNGQVEVV